MKNLKLLMKLGKKVLLFTGIREPMNLYIFTDACNVRKTISNAINK
jgi:hypothetical protein